MSGSQESTQHTNQTSKTEPWGPAREHLVRLLGDIGRYAGGYDPTNRQERALGGLRSIARQGSPFADQISGVAQQFLSGGPDRTSLIPKGMLAGGPDRTGTVEEAYSGLQGNLTPFASGEYVDPSKNPALQGYLSTVGNDVQNRINSMFTSAGRDFSGAHAGTVARGITEGQAPILYDAYNQERGRQLGAIKDLFAGGMQRSGLLSDMDARRSATALQSIGILSDMDARRAETMLRGIAAADAAQQAKSYGPMLMFELENMRKGIPFQNMGRVASLLYPMAGMGGTTKAHGTTTTSTESSPGMMQLLGAGMSGLGLLGGGLF